MSSIRPAGTGREAVASPFMRTLASPRAALVIVSDVGPPDDWPAVGEATPEGNLGHAPGWTCEVRRDSIVLRNPLGEGYVRSNLPDLTTEWLTNVRHDAGCAVFLAPREADAGAAESTAARAAAARTLSGATVRAAVSAEYGRVEPVGRNDPCPCGSGKKYKRCHG